MAKIIENSEPSLHDFVDHVKKHAPSVKMDVHKTGRRAKFSGDNGETEMYLGVATGKWHVKAAGSTEPYSSFHSALHDALKYSDNKYSQKEFKDRSEVAKAGETEDENG